MMMMMNQSTISNHLEIHIRNKSPKRAPH